MVKHGLLVHRYSKNQMDIYGIAELKGALKCYKSTREKALTQKPNTPHEALTKLFAWQAYCTARGPSQDRLDTQHTAAAV